MINFYQYFSLLRPFTSFLLMNTTDKRSQRDNSRSGQPMEVLESSFKDFWVPNLWRWFCDMWINAIKGNNALLKGEKEGEKKYAARNTWKNIDDREHSGRLNVLHLTKKIYLFIYLLCGNDSTVRRFSSCIFFSFLLDFFFLGRGVLWDFSAQGWKY